MAVLNAKTRGATRRILARTMCEGTSDFFTSTATGGSTTTVVDTKHQNGIYPNDFFNNRQIVVEGKWTTDVTDWATGTATWTVPTQAPAAASGDTFEVHSRAGWLKEAYDDAIDRAIQSVAHRMLLDKDDDTLVFQRHRELYKVPTGFARGRLYADIRYNYLARHAPANFDAFLKLRDAAARTRIAQKFQVPDGNPAFVPGNVYVLMSRFGSPTGNIAVGIQADSGGSPDGTDLVSSANVSITSAEREPTFVKADFTADDPVVLTKDTDYWLVVTGDFSVSSANHVGFANDTDAQYALGAIKVYDGSAWSTQAGDLVFLLRSTQPHLIPLESYKHFNAVRGTTKYIRLTDAGKSLLWSHDGSVLHLVGQAYPGLPTADTSTLEIPWDYAVAYAGLQLANAGHPYWQKKPNAAQLIAAWLRTVGDLQQHHRTLPIQGAVEFESL